MVLIGKFSQSSGLGINNIFMNKSGVIWVTGFSGSGKTSVGREIEFLFNKKNLPCIFLDGDDLRSIFSDKWGYSNQERTDLAKVYLKLTSHLSKQGYVVILSAVAMYKEARDWAKENIPALLYVYLEVPEEVRIERDKGTKNIYSKIKRNSLAYDFDLDPDMVIKNYDQYTPEIVAKEIFDKFDNLEFDKVDHGREKHWNSYYKNIEMTVNPSPFAQWTMEKITIHSSILEIGSGNGRDSVFFASQGHKVIGLDKSAEGVRVAKKLKKSYSLENIRFFHGMIDSYIAANKSKNFDIIYCRFVIHAMPLNEEIELINSVAKILNSGGKFFIECRSINDPLARKGDVISLTERIDGHYRRFIVFKDLINRLENAGFKIEESYESDGLAVTERDDPVLIRVIATI